MTVEKKLNLAIFGICFSLISITGGVVAAHFLGIQSAVEVASAYTDRQISEVNKRMDRTEDRTYKALDGIYQELKSINEKIRR